MKTRDAQNFLDFVQVITPSLQIAENGDGKLTYKEMESRTHKRGAEICAAFVNSVEVFEKAKEQLFSENELVCTFIKSLKGFKKEHDRNMKEVRNTKTNL